MITIYYKLGIIVTRVGYGSHNDSLIDTARWGRIADTRYSTAELEAQLMDAPYVGPSASPSVMRRLDEVDPPSEFAVNNRSAPDFSISNLYLPEADMTADSYIPETDSETESVAPEERNGSAFMEWSSSHTTSFTYVLPAGIVTVQVTEHVSWVLFEQHWEELYQDRYYFSTSPPRASQQTTTPSAGASTTATSAQRSVSPAIPIPGASPRAWASTGAVPKLPRAKPNLLKRIALRNRLSPQESPRTVEQALEGSLLSGFRAELSPEEPADDEVLIRPIEPLRPVTGTSPTLRPLPTVHPLQHLRQLSNNTARLLWEEAASVDLPSSFSSSFNHNTVEMPTARPFYMEDIDLPSSIPPPTGCKRPRSLSASCLEQELSNALEVLNVHSDSYPINMDPMATMAVYPPTAHMLTLPEAESNLSVLLPTPPNLPSPSVTDAENTGRRYRPFRKMNRRPAKRYQSGNGK